VVGETDGPFEGDIDGPLLGLFEGDWLGLCVGYGFGLYERSMSKSCIRYRSLDTRYTRHVSDHNNDTHLLARTMRGRMAWDRCTLSSSGGLSSSCLSSSGGLSGSCLNSSSCLSSSSCQLL